MKTSPHSHRVPLAVAFAIVLAAPVAWFLHHPTDPPAPALSSPIVTSDRPTPASGQVVSSVPDAGGIAQNAASPRDARNPKRVLVHRQPDQAPSWAVPYGKEFWRRPLKPGGAGPS